MTTTAPNLRLSRRYFLLAFVLLPLLLATLWFPRHARQQAPRSQVSFESFDKLADEIFEMLKLAFGEDWRKSASELAGELDWLDREQRYLGPLSQRLVANEEGFRTEQDTLRWTKAELDSADTFLKQQTDDARNREFEVKKRIINVQADLEVIAKGSPYSPEAFPAAQAEFSRLKSLEAQYISQERQILAEQREIYGRVQRHNATGHAYEDRRKRFVYATTVHEEEVARYIERCRTSTTRARALSEALAARINTTVENTGTIPGDTEHQAADPGTEEQTATPEPIGKKSATQDVAENIIGDLGSDLLKVFIEGNRGKALNAMRSAGVWRGVRTVVDRGTRKAGWVGVAWSAYNVLVDSANKSMDAHTEEVARNILLIGDYARALKDLKERGQLHPGDPSYDAIMEMLRAQQKEMATSDRTVAGVNWDYVRKSFRLDILLSETAGSIGGHYAGKAVGRYAPAAEKVIAKRLTRVADTKFTRKGSQWFFKTALKQKASPRDAFRRFARESSTATAKTGEATVKSMTDFAIKTSKEKAEKLLQEARAHEVDERQ